MKVKRPVLRYHGGKWRLAPWIIEHFPEHRTYVEPFGGAASVLIRKQRSYSEVYNDRWSIVVDVFKVLRDPDQAAELCRRIALTPYARDEFMTANHGDIVAHEDPIERARLTIFRSFAGFGTASMNGEHVTGFRADSNKSHTTPAHDWMNYPAHVASFVERLRGVVIENRDAADILRLHDRPNTLHYVDPPYPHIVRNVRRGNAFYAHEMSDDDHRALADLLGTLEGMVIVSGYHCDLYDKELFPSWNSVEREALADGARKRTEVLWFNDAAWNALPSERQRPAVQPDLYEVVA